MTRVAVIGGGAWGTTIASLLTGKADTVLWALEPEVAEAINGGHENTVYLPGLPVAPDLRATTELGAALAGADAVILAVPSRHYRTVLEQAAPAIGARLPILSLTKGIEERSLLRMTQVAAEVLSSHDHERIGVLSGPNIAREVAAGEPAATVIAVPHEETGRELQQLLMTATLRVYTNPDVVGCELGGAVKNVIALAAGMAAGLGLGQNTLAALVTRGLAEMTRLSVALGGQPLTSLGLAGIGDLSVTCHSTNSRNRHVGEELGRGRALEDIVASMRSVAEGVQSCGPVLALGTRAAVELPICEQVGAVLCGEQRVYDAVEELLQRVAKPELRGLTEDAATEGDLRP